MASTRIDDLPDNYSSDGAEDDFDAQSITGDNNSTWYSKITSQLCLIKSAVIIAVIVFLLLSSNASTFVTERAGEFLQRMPYFSAIVTSVLAAVMYIIIKQFVE